MAKAVIQASILTASGKIAPGATITIRENTTSGSIAAVYSDREGTVPIGNPFVADENGFFRVYVDAGVYGIRAVAGAHERTWEYFVALESAAGGDGAVYNTHADYFYVARGNLGGIGGGFAPDVWYSIGPTGSGADKEWTALDSVPTGAPWAELFISVSAAEGVTAGVLRGRKHGSSGTSSNGDLANLGTGTPYAQVTRKISLDANRMFDLYTNAIGGEDPSIGVDAFITGYAT